MPTHITDSTFLKDLYGTAEMRAVFDDMSLLQRWLDVEVALALAEAELGVIPAEAAAEIARKGKAELMDTARIKQGVDQTVHPIVPLIRVFAAVCEGGAGEYIHWGATTQDIMDTANVLQFKQAVAIFERRLDELAQALAGLASQYRDTPMAGRTHGQQALPITFGFKVAVWLAELMRHQERLQQCKPRVLVGQFAGAAGTLASVGEVGLQIQRRMMEILGLSVPVITWHTARDGYAEFATLLAMIGATMGKLAHEVILLQMTEVWEVEEPFNEGKVGSSTMPHKRNPMLCEAILALARLGTHLAPNAFDSMIQEHERDWTGDHMDWAYLPDLCVMTDGALALTVRVMQGLRIHPERMARNLDVTNGLLLSEQVMLALGRAIGRQTAHDVVYECAMRAIDEDVPFRDVLTRHPAVSRHLSPADLDHLLDPRQYTGLSGVFVDRVLDEYRRDQARNSP
jgi:adenylosuccinate lyase